MKRANKRIISMLLVALMLLGIVGDVIPALPVSAAIVKRPITEQIATVYRKPGDYTVLGQYSTRSVADQDQEALEEAADALRDAMKARETEIAIDVFLQEADPSAAWGQVWDMAMEHTGDPKEGDYLAWHWNECGGGINGYTSADGMHLTFTYTVSYYTDAAQEAALDEAVENLLADLGLWDATDYEKVCGIYDYVCQNIAYDYANLEDETYELKYSAYAALVNGTSVCQGYALLFYRLALELGVDVRLIGGIGNGGGHAWNIVKLGDYYYNLDATWDRSYYEVGLPYAYFLRSNENFPDHQPDPEYLTGEFLREYPISENDYSANFSASTTWIDFAADSFSGGTGTAESPYLISNAAELALMAKYVNLEMSEYVNAYYTLTKDIDLSGHDWIPIGAIVGNEIAIMGFEGIFDGAGYTISNMNISNDWDDYYQFGLFGWNVGTIKNVILKDAYIAFKITREGWALSDGVGSTLSVGGICGYCSGIIANCQVIDITIEMDAVMSVDCGGVAGDVNYGGISGTSCTGSVSVRSERAIYVGGFVGNISNDVTISMCSFQGAVNGENSGIIPGNTEGYIYGHYVGGFCGSAGGGNSNIMLLNSYVVADVSSKLEGGSPAVGGFAGSIGICRGTVMHENLYCYSSLTVNYAGEVSMPVCFWQGWGWSPQKYAAFWYYKNCVMIHEDLMQVYQRDQESYTITDYDLTEMDIAQIFRDELGFDSEVWLFEAGELPTFREDSNNVQTGNVASGVCGEHLTWTLNEDGLLTISGTGAMYNYSSGGPWYSYLSSIRQVVIEEGVTGICDTAFEKCSSLANITIPNSVTSIGDWAFYYCSSLESITIPDSVTSIGDFAFEGCSSLTGIWVDSDNPSYSSDEFGVLHNKNKTQLIVAPGALSGEYSIADSVTSISDAAFYMCGSLEGVTIPDGLTSINWMTFYMCSSLESVTIPDSVITICDSAFARCGSLKSITIPDSVITIEGYAFLECVNLESITIPDSVTSIGEWAFYYCGSLDEIYFEGDAPSVGEDAFYCVSATAYYPAGNETWTPDAMLNYGGTITWVSYELEGGCENGHTYEAVVTEPTCTEDGYTTHTCATCGDSYTSDVVAAKGHSYEAVVTEPTCTEDGYTTHTCENCGDSYTTDSVAAHGHSFGDWQTDREPTCAEPGSKSRTCATCGETEVEEIPALPHDFVDGECAECGAPEAAPGDVNGDGRVDTTDAKLIMQYDLGIIDATGLNLSVADVNGDGKIDTTDAKLIMQLDLGIITEFPTP